MVAIKGMKMPKCCTEVIEKEDNDGWINASIKRCPLYNVCKEREVVRNNFKPAKCPLVEVATCKDESSCNSNKNVPQYRIRKFMHSRTLNETKITDEGYVDEIITGEEGLEEFAKTRNISIIKRDNNGHIFCCVQKEHTMSGGFEGCFFEFVPEEVSS